MRSPRTAFQTTFSPKFYFCEAHNRGIHSRMLIFPQYTMLRQDFQGKLIRISHLAKRLQTLAPSETRSLIVICSVATLEIMNETSTNARWSSQMGESSSRKDNL